MKINFAKIPTLILLSAIASGCGMLPGTNPSAPPSTPIGPINSNYSNAISPAQQLIIGTMNLKGNLVVSSDEAAQLVNNALQATFAESEEIAGRGPGGKLYVTYDIARQFAGYGVEAGAASSEFAERIIQHLSR